MQRRCVCGFAIAQSTPLCARCARKYGTKVQGWPEWLKYWVRHADRERKRESRHLELEYNDDIDYEINKSGKVSTGAVNPTGFETEYDEWGNKTSWIGGFEYIDTDKQRNDESKFNKRLKALKNQRNVND